MEVRFEKIDAMLKDPKSEVNTDCLLVSSVASGSVRAASETSVRGQSIPWREILSVTNKSPPLSLKECAEIDADRSFWSARVQ